MQRSKPVVGDGIGGQQTGEAGRPENAVVPAAKAGLAGELWAAGAVSAVRRLRTRGCGINWVCMVSGEEVSNEHLQRLTQMRMIPTKFRR